MDETLSAESWSTRRVAGLVVGALLAGATYLLLPEGVRDEAGKYVDGLSPQGRIVAAVGVLMAVWWVTEALPLAVTSLLPLGLFPVFGAVSMREAAAPYATDIIFLFLGGMLLGASMERWGLHRRFALAVLGAIGASPARLVGGFLCATALVSMWVSNTAATVMMLPIGASVAMLVGERLNCPEGRHEARRGAFSAALMLAIAFGATIGGVATLIGTPPIGQFAAFMETRLDRSVGFVEWMTFGVPVVVLMLPLTWLALTRVAFSIRGEAPEGVRELIAEQRSALGGWSGGERGTLAVFVLAGLGWVTSTWTGVPDAAIAVLAASLLFVIPAGGGTNRALLTWSEGAKVPWGVLLLFGGGLSLASAASATGVDAFLATRAEVLGGAPLWLTLFVVALAAILMTEFMSNTALVAIALPVVLLMAEPLGVPPAALLVTVTLAASLGFALPAGTAPNALVFSSGRVTIRQMIRGGIVVDVAAAVLVPLAVMAAMKLGVLPGL